MSQNLINWFILVVLPRDNPGSLRMLVEKVLTNDAFDADFNIINLVYFLWVEPVSCQGYWVETTSTVVTQASC